MLPTYPVSPCTVITTALLAAAWCESYFVMSASVRTVVTTALLARDRSSVGAQREGVVPHRGHHSASCCGMVRELFCGGRISEPHEHHSASCLRPI